MELYENPTSSADENISDNEAIQEIIANASTNNYEWYYEDSSDEELIEVWESIALQQSDDAKQEKSQDGVVLFLHDISQENATQNSENIPQDNFK